MRYDYKKIIFILREKLVISQMELADMLGVSFASVNRWERGHHEPTIKAKRKILNLCEEYNINIEKFGE